MARAIRFIPEGGAVVEVTGRTLQGRLLLRPSQELRAITIGILARAKRLYGVQLHSFIFLSNRFHLLVSVQDAQQLSSFMCYVNSNLAREAGRLYILSHGVKEGLVERPQEESTLRQLPGKLAQRRLISRLWNASRGTPAGGRGSLWPRLDRARGSRSRHLSGAALRTTLRSTT